MNSNRINRQELLRARDVATMCGIGRSTVWRYSKQGRITPIKISNGVTVFRRDEIERVFKLKPNDKEVA